MDQSHTRSATDGTKRVKTGLSDTSDVFQQIFPETETWHEEYMTSDIVLDVQDIQKYGEKLGDKVTRDTIPNGIHDLILSQKPYRNDAYQTIFEWLKKQ